MTNKELALEALRTTKQKFHELVNAIEAHEMKLPSNTTKRTVRGVLAHLLISTEKAYPMLVTRAKKNKDMPSFFGTKLGHYFSYRFSEYRGSKLKNKKDFISEYNRHHDNLEKVINSIETNEWKLSTKLPKPSNKSLTILEVFTKQIPGHFEVHRNEIINSIKQP